MFRPKRRKIFYVPGTISLLIVPFLFIHYANTELNDKPLYCLRISILDRDLIKKYYQLFPQLKDSIPPRRNYIDIILNGNNKDDKAKLDFAQIRIREMISKDDLINGVRFQFGDNSEFWTYVKSINISLALRYKSNIVNWLEIGSLKYCN